MGLFEKKKKDAERCPICGKEISFFSGLVIADGTICDDCEKMVRGQFNIEEYYGRENWKISTSDPLKAMTVEELKDMINEKKAEQTQVVEEIGGDYAAIAKVEKTFGIAPKAALLLALGLALSMTACGNKESETVTPDNSTTPEAVEPQPTQEATGTEETTSRDDTGVYPNATGLTEVAMGVTEDICTFKVPLNYVLAGGYYDENNEEHTIQGLNSATTTVEEALAAGSFSTGNHLAFFTMTSLDADQTMITTGMYTPDIMSWDDFKAYYTDAKEIGDESVPGLLYHVEAISGQCVAVAVKVSDDVTLQIVYEGSLEGEIGEDELGQRLYELVTVK